MRFVHSFNTRPMAINIYNVDAMKRLLGNVIFYATSLAYLKKLGQEVVMHTDTLGARLLQDLSYDELHLTLDNIPSTLHPRLWAAGKIYALEAEPAGSIHIDGDVFIKRRSLIESMEKADYDVMVQNVEPWLAKYADEVHLTEIAENMPLMNYGIDITVPGSFNNGVIGIRDAELKNRYIQNYKELSGLMSGKLRRYLDANNVTPDLLIEQQLLYVMSKGYKVHTLIDDISDCEEPKKKGYQHVLTLRKFNHLDECMGVLKMLDHNTYKKIKKLCQSILKN